LKSGDGSFFSFVPSPPTFPSYHPAILHLCSNAAILWRKTGIFFISIIDAFFYISKQTLQRGNLKRYVPTPLQINNVMSVTEQSKMLDEQQGMTSSSLSSSLSPAAAAAFLNNS